MTFGTDHDILLECRAKLDAVLGLLNAFLIVENTMSKEVDDLATQVKANTDLEQSAITLIKGLADQLAAAKDDPAKIVALTNELKNKASLLADAITAGTPASPSP